MTLIELKAQGYDLLAVIQDANRRLAEINRQIANYREPEVPQPGE